MSHPCDKSSVLIVDAEPSIVRLFKVKLSTAIPEVQIDTAANGEEALHLFSEKHHRVLLMDLHMPVMDGRVAFGKIEQLCESLNWEMPSVVFCTGFAPPESVKTVVAKNPAHCLLSKPVAGRALVDAVKSRLQ